MKQSYNNENLHNELTLKIKEFIDSMDEFETTPFHQTEEGYQKSFGVLSDNGNSNVMKRFTIMVEDHKTQNNMELTPKEKAEQLVDEVGIMVALFVVNEILDVDCKSMNEDDFNEHIEFYDEVKQEILKLK